MYLEYFGLDRFPFQLTPDVSFFYDSRVHKRALATITYGLSKREGFVVITGEVGSGKTTLIEFLLSSRDVDNRKIARVSPTQRGSGKLLGLLAMELGLRYSESSKAAHLANLKDCFFRTAAEGSSVLLIVDEVQNLSSAALEELRMLSNFQDREKPLVQLLLVGQPEFRERLRSRECEQIRQRVTASYHLNPLTETEIPVYITHRLKRAGRDGHPIFTGDSHKRIHRETGGVPRKINRLCDRLLLYAYLEDIERIDSTAVDAVAREMREESLADDIGGGGEQPASAPARRPSPQVRPADPADPRATGSGKAGTRAGRSRRAGDYSELLRTLDDLRKEVGEYRTKMDQIMRLVERNGRQGANS